MDLHVEHALTEGGLVASHAERVTSLLADFLGPGERILGCARMARGHGVVDIHLPDTTGSSPQAAQFPWVSRPTLAFTTERLIVVERSAVTGRPRSIVGAVSMSSIESARSAGDGVVPDGIELIFLDGSSLTLALHPEDPVISVMHAITEAKRSWVGDILPNDESAAS
jgi:hypothetical protein